MTRLFALALASCATVAAAPARPVARATKLANEQVSRALHHTKLDPLFDPAAIVWAPQQMTLENGVGAAGMFQENPHDHVLDASVRDVVAGGDDDIVWTTFDVVAKIQPAASTPTTSLVRGMELVVGGKIVSAAFVIPHPPCACQPPLDLLGATEPGPLAALATDPAKLSAALYDDPNVLVLGPDRERAVGPKAAAEQLAKLAAGKWTMRGKPHEVDGPSWGVLDAQLDLGPPQPGEKFPLRVGMQLYALRMPHDVWRVVAVRYLPL